MSPLARRVATPKDYPHGITTGAFIVVMAFLTAALSGVFGMAGGLAA